jgi:3-hydroxybutyryl-CoA dehydrogenase
MEDSKIFVAGTGLMGTGIIQTALQAGYKVFMYDVSEEALKKAASEIDIRLTRNVAKEKITQTEKDACMARLIPSSSLAPAAECGIVIEAVFEKLEIKSALFRQLGEICSKETMLASNTSSLSITALAASVPFPARFIGTHFFVPVPVMQLLEIICGMCTSDETLSRAQAMGKRLGKVTIVSKDMPGFIVNRLAVPLVNEAVQLIEDGMGSVEDIDTGARAGLRHPMGPLERIDLMGLDVALAVMEIFHHDFGDQKYRPSTLLRRMVKAGFCGKKSGAGFYRYDEQGNKLGPNPVFTKGILS